MSTPAVAVAILSALVAVLALIVAVLVVALVCLRDSVGAQANATAELRRDVGMLGVEATDTAERVADLENGHALMAQHVVTTTHQLECLYAGLFPEMQESTVHLRGSERFGRDQ